MSEFGCYEGICSSDYESPTKSRQLTCLRNGMLGGQTEVAFDTFLLMSTLKSRGLGRCVYKGYPTIFQKSNSYPLELSFIVSESSISKSV